MSVYPSTSQKAIRGVKRLARLFEKGQVSNVTAQTLNKLVNYEANEAELQLKEIQKDLDDYEKQYGMSSAEFLKKYLSGQTDDRMDFVEWASLTQMANSLRKRLDYLTGQDSA